MLFDPLLHYEARKLENSLNDNLQMTQMELMTHSAFSPTMGSGAPSAIGAIVFWQEIEKLQLGASIRKAIKGVREKLFASDPDPLSKSSPIDRRFGIDLPLADDAYKAMMDEVERYRWLEAERAGRDIWRERNPVDPETAAFQEWFRNHFGAWYIAHYGRKAARA